VSGEGLRPISFPQEHCNLRDIVVRAAMQSNGEIDSGTAFAISLAKGHEALLTILLGDIRPMPALDEEGNRPSAEIDAARQKAERIAGAARAAAEGAAIRHDVVIERSLSFSMGEVFADYARVRDIAVLGVSGVLDGETRLLAESVFFGSGRPLILVPDGAHPPAGGRVVIAWDATPAAVHAIAGAMRMLKTAREIVVITVTDDKKFRRGQSGIELCRHLERHGNEAAFEAVERKEREVGDILLEASHGRGADLLVMGVYAHSTLRGLIFGSATRGVLKRPLPLPILMAH
jgi:nucleotide-binding universal stress UspA family protein